MSAKRAFFGIFQKIMVVCCAIFFGFANAFSANLPSGYTELEYIEGTGTQYITTDVIANQNTSAEIKFVPTSVYKSNGVFGARTSKTSNAFNIWEPGSEGVIIANYNNKGSVVSNVTPVLNETYVVYLSSTRFSVNNNTVSISNTGSFSTPGGLQLFNIYGGDCSTTTSSSGANRLFSGKVYYFKVWQGDSLALNLVPAKNSSGVVGMYDTVNNRFYQNAGTGTFTAGPEVPENQIKIATTAYNSARFSPVQTDLNNAVATIREIVTKTINQTAAIASLQADKQTRPEDACPAGKKCLLVEDNNGKPHWYEIIENIYGLPNGYTALEYIETSGSQYIVLPNFPTASNIDITTDVLHTDGTNEQIFLAPASGIQYLYTVSTGWRVWKSGGGAANIASLGGRHSIKIKTTSSGCEYYVDGQKNTDVPASLFTSAEFSGKTFNLGARTVASGGDYYWKGRIYSFYAECDSEECMNLVPAKRNSDGAIGMYDLTNLNPATAFYTNSGTGTFTAGPEI